MAIAEVRRADARIGIDWGGPGGLAILLDRHRRLKYTIVQGDPLGETRSISNATSANERSSDFSIKDCLSMIDAERSELFEVYLHGANLRDANLTSSNLSGAHLCDALVSGANLQGVRFDRAHLDRVDFSNSQINEASFRDARIGMAQFTVEQLHTLHLTVFSLLDMPRNQATDLIPNVEITHHVDDDAIRRYLLVLEYMTQNLAAELKDRAQSQQVILDDSSDDLSTKDA